MVDSGTNPQNFKSMAWSMTSPGLKIDRNLKVELLSQYLT